MYSEIVKPIDDKKQSGLGITFGLVLLLIIIVGFANFLYNRYGITYGGYIAFLLYVLIGIYVYRKKIVRYRYSLIKGELILESLAGRRSKEIMRINLKEILYFCPISKERLDKATDYKSHYITHNRKSTKAWVLAFKSHNKIHRIIFEPSDKLVGLIKNS